MSKPLVKLWLQALRSACCAFFGVQSEQQYREDFSSRSPWRYIFSALFLLVLFVAVLVFAVVLILPSS
ncbi:MAG: DUF2970 domain-containing protein [Pseudomonadales bacterium]